MTSNQISKKSLQTGKTSINIILGLILLSIGAAGGVYFGKQNAHDSNSSAQNSANANSTTQRKVLYWYDPMKPDQKFDKGGKSPFMDMQLVPRYADEGSSGADNSAALTISMRSSQSLGMRFAQVKRESLAQSVEVAGTIGLNERDISIVQARSNGFVERVYARAVGDVIKAGSPLVDVLNPEWIASQQEFLAVKKMSEENSDNKALFQAAKQRMLLLGMSPELIARVERENKVIAIVTISAPISGLISALDVRQGMTLSSGMTLAKINGLSSVWLELALPEVQTHLLKMGQNVEIRLPALLNTVLTGKVAAILPEANSQTRTFRVRVELPNPNLRLRAGMFAQATLKGETSENLLVPIDSVIRTGKRNVVYLVQENGQYQATEVEIGAEQDGNLSILRGLSEGQKIVASGQFLLDSEANMRGILPLGANQHNHNNQNNSNQNAAKTAVFETLGIIQEIDLASKSITLKHEPIPALKWPAMTMPFNLPKNVSTKAFKTGDQIRFEFKTAPNGDDYEIVSIKSNNTNENPLNSSESHANHGDGAIKSDKNIGQNH